MSNHSDLRLYLVAEGEVTEATPETKWDGKNSILIAATCESSACHVACAYDAGEVQADNLAWNGETISVVTMQDENGWYL